MSSSNISNFTGTPIGAWPWGMGGLPQLLTPIVTPATTLQKIGDRHWINR
ncbi:MAG: hypothetical protein HC799_00625 [Limnothrix sp. RL_2_0]|nr:hypothetical protein [Limnothrix sp. RL_2_0]